MATTAVERALAMMICPEELRPCIEGLGRIELSSGDLVRLCGITPRQVAYWAEHGYIPHETAEMGDRGRLKYIFGLDAVVKIHLIKQALDKGLGLKEAVSAAEDFIKPRVEELERRAALSDAELEAEIVLKLGRLRRFGVWLRDLRGAVFVRACQDLGAKNPHLPDCLSFMQARPYAVFTASQVATGLAERATSRPANELLRRLKERQPKVAAPPTEALEVRGALDYLAELGLVDRIVYPGASIYRYRPSRR